jgi:hypothetical protein
MAQLDDETVERLEAIADALEDARLQLAAILGHPPQAQREVPTPPRAERQEDKAGKLELRREQRARAKREAAERMALEDDLEGSTDAPPSLNLGGDL